MDTKLSGKISPAHMTPRNEDQEGLVTTLVSFPRIPGEGSMVYCLL